MGIILLRYSLQSTSKFLEQYANVCRLAAVSEIMELPADEEEIPDSGIEEKR